MAIPINTLIKAIRKCNGNISTVAQSLGISRQAVYKRIERNKNLQIEVEQAIERNVDFMETKLLKLANENYFPAIRLYLLTKGKKRGYTLKDTNEIDKDKYNINITYEIVKNEKDKKDTK